MTSKQIQKSYERLSLIASKKFMNLPREMHADMTIAGVKQMTGSQEPIKNVSGAVVKLLEFTK